MVIGISELQKDISIFKDLNQTVQVVDKKTKEILTIILPKQTIQNISLTESLGGILSSSKPTKKYHNVNEMIDDAHMAEISDKYGK